MAVSARICLQRVVRQGSGPQVLLVHGGASPATTWSAWPRSEGDLLAHPHIGLEHLELARLRLASLEREREALHQLAQGGPTTLVASSRASISVAPSRRCRDPRRSALIHRW